MVGIRINPKLGYVEGNVCLICGEFNGIDTTSSREYEGSGSGAWSRKKFEIIYNSMLNKWQIV